MVRLTSQCCDHEEHSIEVRETNDDFIDMNAALRDLTKGVLLIEESRQVKSLCLTVAGGDWAGMWTLRVFCGRERSKIHGLFSSSVTNHFCLRGLVSLTELADAKVDDGLFQR
jgi:hypothetical protein